jgi:hypothetical protein
MTGSLDGDSVTLEIAYDDTAPNPGYTVYADGTIGSNGTMAGTCTTSANQSCTWETTSGGAVKDTWYAADGTEIGPVIWGAFAIIQQVENDPCAGIHGLQYASPDHPGLGGW